MSPDEIERRRRWALGHNFPPRAAENYAMCDDPEEEQDWMDWYDARLRAAQAMCERISNLVNKHSA